jgi:secreted Zn-dependent insulinase-like peptidase
MSIKMIFNLKVPNQIILSKIQTNKEEIKNTTKLNPWEYSDYYFSKMIKSNNYTDDKLLKEIDKISVEDVQKYMQELLSNETSLTSYYYGNLLRDTLPKVLLLNKYYFNPPLTFPQNRTVKNIDIKHPNKQEKSNCVTIYYPIGNFIPLIWLLGFIVELILEPTFYTVLRTKKQLGYLVHMSFINCGEEYFILQKIQSEKSCEEINKEINNFNLTLLELIKEANLEEFKTSAENQLKEKDKSLSEVYSKYFSEIVSRTYLFDRKKIILQKLSQITTDSLLDFTKKYILENKNKIQFNLNSN